MNMPGNTSATFRVEVNGQPLPDDVGQLLVAAAVDDGLDVPDRFELRFRDPDRVVVAKGQLEVGAEVRIAVVSDGAEGGHPLISGEVVALEAGYDPTGTWTLARGFDRSHRLFRGRRTETYLNSSYAEIVERVARRAGLEPGQVDPTPPAPDHVSQADLTDREFLTALADEIGFEVTVRDGALDLRRPADAQEGPEPANLDPQDPLQLSVGTNLLRLRAAVTSAQQVSEVEVRGWDVGNKRHLIGRAPTRTRTASLPVTPAGLAEEFGSSVHVMADIPYASQPEVDSAAEVAAERIGSAFAQLEGVAVGIPQLRAGRAVSIGLLGQPFDGRYTVTTSRHVYDPREGYTTSFVVSGLEERSLLQLTGGPTGGRSRRRIDGVVVGIVSDNRDPERLGRVKLTFPWLSDSFVSDWARVAFTGAGSDRGMTSMPEVNDEVLVSFDRGDLRRPFVVGGLYNGVDRPFPEGFQYLEDSSGRSRLSFIRSRSGQAIIFADGEGEEGLGLRTGDSSHQIELSQHSDVLRVTTGGRLVIHSSGDADISVEGDATINGRRDVQITAGGQLTLEGTAGVRLSSGGPVEVKGTPIKLN